tara:strand:- start:465 stop:1052 length:588 start_codon:yes stop_codon:yes gene_type:complete
LKYLKKKNIGILGGTFDPPHLGHLRISNIALRKLKLDEIWWIVSSSNPLKKIENITEFDKRFENSKRFVRGNKIWVSDIEKKLNTKFSINVISYLQKKYSKKKFIWIMGVDNLKKFHLWKNWKEIISKVPIAIFDRPFYSLNILNNKSFSFYKNKRVNFLKAAIFKNLVPPCWIFLTGWSTSISSTKIKKKINEP